MIVRIKERLQNNEDEILHILEEIGCFGIKHVGNRFQFGSDEHGKHTGNIVNIDTLSYRSFSHNKRGDIITLVGDMLNVELGEAIQWLGRKLNIKNNYVKREVVKPFGGFWSGLSKIRELDETPPTTYPLSCLRDYGISVSKMFLEDNITAKTQEMFMIGYDYWTNRITIPWMDIDGSLCGVIGRINKYDVSDTNYKYLALLQINKSKLLFGLNVNYKNILNYGICYVFESEKSTMQLYGYGVEHGVSIGCKTISMQQARVLKSLYCDVIVCLDEGVSEEEIIKECEKVKIHNPFFTNKVGYIFDREGKYLKKGSKCSPSDLGENIFKKLLDECVIWL